MNARRVTAVARKEFLHVLRDPRSLGMAIAIPMLMLMLFGYALTLDVDHVPLVVWDQSRTPDSRELVSRFAGSPYFSLRALRRQLARHGPGHRLRRGPDGPGRSPTTSPGGSPPARDGPVASAIVDGSDSNTATIAMGYADAIAEIYSQELDDPAASAARARRKSRSRWTSAAGSGSTPTWSRRTTSCPA